MEKATISELKNRLREYLTKVRAGHTVLIFDRDQPVARLERVTGDAQGEGRLVRLERAGLLRRARSEAPRKALRAAVPKAKRSVTQALLAERRDGDEVSGRFRRRPATLRRVRARSAGG